MKNWTWLLTVLWIVGLMGPTKSAIAGTAYTEGDVFVSVRNTVEEFTPTGTLVQTLNDGSGDFASGTGFDAANNLYVTNFSFSGGYTSQFNNTGTLTSAVWGQNGPQPIPESIIYDPANGNFFVGGPFVPSITEFNAAGSVVHTYFVSNVGTTGGTDWVTLQNSNTLLYLGEGKQIDSLNLTTGVSSTFGNALPTNSFELKVIPSGAFTGDILVAGSTAAYLLSSDGSTVLQTYSLPGNDGSDFSLSIDPNLADFWTSDNAGEVWEINIGSGAIVEQWNTGSGTSTTFGLSTLGEPSAVATPEPGTLGLVGLGLSALIGVRRKLSGSRL